MIAFDLPPIWPAIMAALAVAGALDLRTREVPAWYFPAAGIGAALWAGIPDIPAFLCLAALYLVLCAAFGFGGADGLALGLLALCMGWASLYVAIAAFLADALWMAAARLAGRRGPCPFLPFVCAAFALYALCCFCFGAG